MCIRDSLKAAKNLLKNVAYLADLDQTHTVRQDLLLLLEQKERELEESAEDVYKRQIPAPTTCLP